MLLIGCDYHPSVQQIAWVDKDTGECGERRLIHSGGEAERFYRELQEKGRATALPSYVPRSCPRTGRPRPAFLSSRVLPSEDHPG